MPLFLKYKYLLFSIDTPIHNEILQCIETNFTLFLPLTDSHRSMVYVKKMARNYHNINIKIIVGNIQTLLGIVFHKIKTWHIHDSGIFNYEIMLFSLILIKHIYFGISIQYCRFKAYYRTIRVVKYYHCFINFYN